MDAGACHGIDPGTPDDTSARLGATGRGVFSGTLDRLGMSVLGRGAEAKGGTARDWTSAVLPVVTRVAQPNRRQSLALLRTL